jgi:hypothetical protein
MMGGILVTVLAAVSNDEWEAMRSDIADIRDVVYDIKGSVALHEFRLNELTADQVQFVRDCRANHATYALPLKRTPVAPALEEDSSKGRVTMIVAGIMGAASIVALVGHGMILAWTWIVEHLRQAVK